METQFCLRWNNFSSTMTSALQKLHQGEDFVDVTLATEGVQMKAHKVILSACSPFFRNVLKNNPCQHPVIILKEATVEDLESVLTFMYEGEVNVTQPRLHTFMHLAETLQVRGLTDSHNAPETHSRNNYKAYDCKISTSLDLTTRKRRHSSSSKNNISHKVQDFSAPKLSTRKLSQNAEVEKNNDSNLEHYEVVDAMKRRKYSENHDSNEQEVVLSIKSRSSVHIFPEVKVEHSDGDNHEGKENGDFELDKSNGRGYHLRGNKLKNSSARESPVLKVIEGDVDLMDSVENNQPVLTVPQRLSLGDKKDQFIIPRSSSTEKLSHNFQPEFPQDHACHSLPFPCPFCEKSYTSWGFRRRHIKGYHTGSPKLPCKWCFIVLPTHTEWESHVTSNHNLNLSEARNGLLILDEAHMVLQIAQPTRIESLVDLVKNNKEKGEEKEDKTKENDNGEK